MVTAKADDLRRIQLPDVKPGTVFTVQANGDGTIMLSPLAAKELQPIQARLDKDKDGFTIIVTDRAPDEGVIKSILAEFP